MKRRWLSCLLAACLLTLAVAPTSFHAEELDFPEIELELGTKEETRGEGDDLDKVNNENTGLLEGNHIPFPVQQRLRERDGKTAGLSVNIEFVRLRLCLHIAENSFSKYFPDLF